MVEWLERMRADGRDCIDQAPVGAATALAKLCGDGDCSSRKCVACAAALGVEWTAALVLDTD